MQSSLRVEGLRCEYKTNPLGIDVARPRLSWTLESDCRGEVQRAYQIVVHSDDEPLWDSGRVESDQSTHVVYSGKPLPTATDCRWKVRVWNAAGVVSQWSDPARWTMGLLAPEDWTARWIALPESRSAVPKERPALYLPPCAYFHRQFEIRRAVRRAFVFATAFGLYEVHLNGKKVGDDYFTPGWTDYNKRVYYNTYDVTDSLRSGTNAIGAILAEGWYSGYVGLLLKRLCRMPSGRDRYGNRPHLRVQLRIEYADGVIETLGTNDSWRVATGPHVEADILMGETYDSRLRFPGWSQAGFDDAAWHASHVSHPFKPKTKIEAHPGVPVQETATLEPADTTQLGDGATIFDFGQNFAGRVRLAAAGKDGTKVVLRFAEALRDDGTLMTENLQEARATDSVVLDRTASQVWEPHFTYHGFRYVEVAGCQKELSPDAVTGVVLHSNTPISGSFECSHELVNQLYRNIAWTQRANFFEIPTDCPQRDERLGWTGDAGFYARSATYNADVAAFFTKWLVDLEDSQRRNGAYPNYAPMLYQWSNRDTVNSPAWGDAGVICPYTVYRVYGDTRVIERHYPSMTRFMDYLETIGEGFLGPDRGFGDWLSVGEKTRRDLISTAFWASDAWMMSEMAAAIGREDDSNRFRDLFLQIRETFQRVFVYGDGRLRGNSQTSYALAINLDLLPEELLPSAGQNLVERIEANDGHLSTGFVGLKHLLPALTRIGRLDVAYRILTDTQYPSWGYSIKNGATTIWERWDSWTEEKGFKNHRMNSFCHYALGSVCEWLFDTVAGIDTDGPGFKTILIRPRPGGGLTYVKAAYRSIQGRIAAHWEHQRGVFRLSVEIPPNTTATIEVPTDDKVCEGGGRAEDAKGVSYEGRGKRAAVFRVGSGQYVFESTFQMG